MLNEMAVSMARCFYAQSGKEYDEDDIELYAYGFQLFVMKAFNLITVVIFGLFIGRFFETIAFLAAFISLRIYAGGHHAENPLRCFLSSIGFYALMLTAVCFISNSLVNYISLLFAFLSIFPVLRFAPSIHENKPVGPIQYKKLRKKTVLMLLFQTLIIALTSVLCVVLALQSKISCICLSAAVGMFLESISVIIGEVRNLSKKEVDAMSFKKTLHNCVRFTGSS